MAHRAEVSRSWRESRGASSPIALSKMIGNRRIHQGSRLLLDRGGTVRVRCAFQATPRRSEKARFQEFVSTTRHTHSPHTRDATREISEHRDRRVSLSRFLSLLRFCDHRLNFRSHRSLAAKSTTFFIWSSPRRHFSWWWR